jgi:hypothetical protein
VVIDPADRGQPQLSEAALSATSGANFSIIRREKPPQQRTLLKD